METRHYLSYIYEPETAREDGSAYSTEQNNLRDRIVRKVAEYKKLRDDYDEKIKILEEILEDTDT